MSFSEDMSNLQVLLDKFENSEISLEEALSEFERGIHLIKRCEDFLNDAKQKVVFLSDLPSEEDGVRETYDGE